MDFRPGPKKLSVITEITDKARLIICIARIERVSIKRGLTMFAYLIIKVRVFFSKRPLNC